MYTIRLTRVLLEQFDADDAENASADVPPTTRLGDWYVVPLDVGARRLLLCTSEHSLLSVVLPADQLGDLPEQLVTALVGVLHRLGAPKQAIVDEVDAMTSGGVGPARSRAILGAMRGVSTRAAAFLRATRGDVDVAALYTHLGEYQGRGASQTAAARALTLLTAPPDAAPRARPAASGSPRSPRRDRRS